MTTLIYVGNSDGCVGRCDANCYEATEPECECICGGRNHGVGLQQALVNTAEIVDPEGSLRERMRAMGGDHVAILPELPLFDGEPAPAERPAAVAARRRAARARWARGGNASSPAQAPRSQRGPQPGRRP